MRYQKTDPIFCEPIVGEHSCQISEIYEVSFLLAKKNREVVVICDLVKKGSKWVKTAQKSLKLG